MEPRLRSKRSPPQAELKPGTATSVGQRLIPTELTGLQFLKEAYRKITRFYLHSIPANETTQKHRTQIILDTNIEFTKGTIQDSVVGPDVLTLAQIFPLRNELFGRSLIFLPCLIRFSPNPLGTTEEPAKHAPSIPAALAVDPD